jgi:dienelactone hydrolase
MSRLTLKRILVLCAVLMLNGVRAEDVPYVQHENLVFGEVHGTGLLADVFTPLPSETARPGDGLGIVDVASGAFYSDRGKINDHKKAKMYDIYCGRCYTVFAIRPGSITKYTGMEMNTHVKMGIRWVKAHAADYGVDPDRLGLTGASAGGYLATYAAVTPEAPTGQGDLGAYGTAVKAAAVFFPPTDFTLVDWSQGPLRRLQGFFFEGGFDGKSPEEIAARSKELSPAQIVGDQAPPMLFIHGDADEVVKLEQSQIMVKALQEKGHSAELIVKQGGAHPWPTIYEEVATMCTWFDEHLRKD